MVPPPRGILGYPPQSTPALLISKAALVSAPTAMVTASPHPCSVCSRPHLRGGGGQGAWTLTQIWKWAQKGQVVTCPGTYGGRSSTSHLLREVLLTIHSPCPLRTLRLFVPGKPIRRPPRPLTCTIPAAQAAPHSP